MTFHVKYDIIYYSMKGAVYMATEYYDGTKLLSLKDINGNTPEIFMVTSNRTAGKTTYFGRMLFNRWIKKGSKFMLVYRFSYELDNCAEKFFKDVGQLFFPDYYMSNVKKARGLYHELRVQKVGEETYSECGYAVALNTVDGLKKFSHLFSDTDSMLFDEFQSETNHYCSDEVTKFISLHTSIARGNGKMVRYLPVYMCGNPVTILNPYYVEMDISSRLNKNTRFLRGEGFVLEQGYNEAASKAQKESGFNAAFRRNSYIAYAGEARYLEDDNAFIESVSGRSRYLGTIKYKDTMYGIRAFDDLGVVYCDKKPDTTYPFKIAVTTDDHQINYLLLRQHDDFIINMRYYFDHGCFRFKDLQCKEAVLKLLSY